MVTRPFRTRTFNGLVRRQEVKFFRKKKLCAHQVSKESKFGHFFVVVSDFEILVFYGLDPLLKTTISNKS